MVATAGALAGWVAQASPPEPGAPWWQDPAWASVVVNALAVAVTVLIASVTLWATARDSKARSRPMVIATLRRHPYSDGVQLLVLANAGPSLARDVRVTFDPPLPANAPLATTVPMLARRYARPVTVLAPGAELQNVWWWNGERDASGEWSNHNGLPAQFTVSVSYRGDRRGRFEDTFPLDVLVERMHSGITSSKDPVERAGKAGKDLRAIRAAVQTLAAVASAPVPPSVTRAGRGAWSRRANKRP